MEPEQLPWSCYTNFLLNKTLFVSIDRTYTSFKYLLCGVEQKTILKYILYINYFLSCSTQMIPV